MTRHRGPWRRLLVFGAMLVAAGALQSQDIRQTPHNLRARQAETRDATAMCIFCHAPQGERAAAAKSPQWQPSAGGNGGFSIYAAPIDEFAASNGAGGASMICLSCHDATQAAGIAGGVSDHPIGIPYAGEAGLQVGGVWQSATIEEQARAHRLRALPGSSGAARIGGRSGFQPASRSVIDDRVVWWVPTSSPSARRTRTDLPLYGPLQAGAGLESGAVTAPTVECGTCHDPHSTASMFLRIPNNGSRLCLTCHDI